MSLPAEKLPPHRKNLDVECLRCGAMNLPENQICGRCGASLPLIYDSEGKVLHWGQNQHLQRLLKQGAGKRALNPNNVRWLMRLGVLLAAFLVAWWIMHRR
jgi:hypothetical protein